MKTEIALIGPALAKKWLERNDDNRDVRVAAVTGIADSIRRGEWKLSHQGIAFGKSGRLLDGQHRLMAIIEAGLAVRSLVSWDVDDDAFMVLDIGNRRTAYDILQISRSLAATARFLAVVEDTTKKSSLTPQFLIPFCEAIGPWHASLLEYCPTSRKTWSSSAVQSAAVLRMMDGEDQDYVKMVYHALVHLEFDSMPPIAQTLFRQLERGSVRANNIDFFARSLKVFSKANSQMKSVQISTIDTSLAYARDVIAREIRGTVFSKKKAAIKGGQKSVKTVREHITA